METPFTKQRFTSQTLPKLLLLVIASVTLSACHDDAYYADAHYYEEDYQDTPTLYEFHVIDTYETNTEFDTQTDLALSPYVNFGHFELFWDTDSFDDYMVEFRFNTHPSPQGARLITSQWCGPYDNCHRQQYQFCEYNTDMTLGCELSNYDYQSNYIGDYLTHIPEDAYLILQVCDPNFFFCEYQAHPVSME